MFADTTTGRQALNSVQPKEAQIMSQAQQQAEERRYREMTVGQEIDERIAAALNCAERLQQTKARLPDSILNLTREQRGHMGILVRAENDYPF